MWRDHLFSNIGALRKIGGLAPLWQLCKETLKISHSHYKTNPPFLAFSPFLVNIFHPSPPHYSHFRKFLSPFHYDGWVRGFGLCIKPLCVVVKEQWMYTLLSSNRSICLNIYFFYYTTQC